MHEMATIVRLTQAHASAPSLACCTRRANVRIMLFTVAIASMAAFNALCVPLVLESQIGAHPATEPVRFAGACLRDDKHAERGGWTHQHRLEATVAERH